MPKDFYKNVYTINKLALFADDLYRLSTDKIFLNYLLAFTYTSESFIWGQRGLSQAYYKEGLPWIAGTKVSSLLSKDFAALSSAAGDVLIFLFLLNHLNPEVDLWVAQE